MKNPCTYASHTEEIYAGVFDLLIYITLSLKSIDVWLERIMMQDNEGNIFFLKASFIT